MLVTERVIADLHHVLELFQKFERDTLSRYRTPISFLVDSIRTIETGVREEVTIQNQLNNYKARGYNVTKYAELDYETLDDLRSRMRLVDASIAAIEKIKAEAGPYLSKMSQAQRSQFELLCHEPDQAPRLLQFWGSIKISLRSQMNAGK